MRKIIDKFNWLQLLFGFILIAVGVLTIVLVINIKEDEYEKYIYIAWASTLFLVALMLILFDLIAFSKTAEFGGLIASGICVGIGVFVLVNQNLINEAVTTLLPYILISIGGVLLLKTIILAVKRISFKEWLLAFILGIVFLSGGIIFLVVHEAQKVLYGAIGIILIVVGAVEIIGYITIKVNQRAAMKGGAVDRPRGGYRGGNPEIVEGTPKNELEPIDR